MPTRKARKTNTLQNVAALKVLLNAIAVMPKSQYEIKDITGLTNSTISRWLGHLHLRTPDQKNLVYISEWKRKSERGNWTAMWSLGYGLDDAPKPKPLTASQYAKRWREKKERQSAITLTTTGVKHVAR